MAPPGTELHPKGSKDQTQNIPTIPLPIQAGLKSTGIGATPKSGARGPRSRLFGARLALLEQSHQGARADPLEDLRGAGEAEEPRHSMDHFIHF